MTTAPHPSLPMPRGPLSWAVISTLAGGAPGSMPAPPETGRADPLGGDLQLALQVCYELHYRGFRDVDPEWEWDPDLIAVRNAAERRFLTCLRSAVPGGTDPEAALDAVTVPRAGADSVAGHLRDHGTWEQMREYFAHRSIYHLKEADPLAWAIPRLHGPAKAAFVAVEFDEFGGGRPERVHARLFEDLLRAANLDHRYLGYLDDVPPETLATANLVSAFGLHRGLRGALVGHFATAETTTPPGARALVAALERMQAPAECVRFYTEHVEADAVHEQVLRHDVVAALVTAEPELAGDVVFGVQATTLLEDRLSRRLLECWRKGSSSLLSVHDSSLHEVGSGA
ncbi:iron-containing redox enzyme family protein [Rhodococcus sp. NPDC003318]|uniref:iron-containing redox enzyme family protein n=1 Tax=Rhodococcus sp. NPDC003318 TaxID=3364503 RepID=UPI0036C80935